MTVLQYGYEYLYVDINALRHFYPHFLLPDKAPPFWIISLDEIRVTGYDMKIAVIV